MALPSSAAVILLAEDEPFIRSMIVDELEGRGMTVVAFANADRASSYVASGGPVDVIRKSRAQKSMTNGC